ncbi:MAG: phosphatase PAP2 family protein [Thermanaerothrix sp.]|nr:phosphatase PAP2 family protein [Thermanaerothrix sp.]
MDQITWVIAFQNLGTWLLPWMSLFSTMGTEQFYMLVMPLIFWCVDAGIGLRFALLLFLSGAINTYVKFLFHAPRPFWVEPQVQALSVETSFGVPSGHAQNAASLWGFGTTLVKSKGLKWFMVLMIILIGLSRVYLGVHFVSDVVAGWLIGVVLLGGFLWLEPRFLRWWQGLRSNTQLLWVLISSGLIMALGGIIAFIYRSWTVPAEWVAIAQSKIGLIPLQPFSLTGLVTIAGTWFGALGGWVIFMQRWQGYPTGGTVIQRTLRYVLGIAGIGLFYVGLGLALNQLLASLGMSEENLVALGFRYLRFVIVGAWVTAGAPWVFKMLGLYSSKGG